MNESLVLLIGDLAWPVTVLLITSIVLISQREPVGRLIDRMRTVSFPGGQAQLAVPEERAGLISEVLGSLSDRLGLPSATPLPAGNQIQNREPVLAPSSQPMMQVKTLAELRAGAANILTELAFPPPPAGIGTVSATIDVLRTRGVLDTEQAASLNRMIEVADEAASGALVPPRVQAAVQNSGTAILDQLELLRTVAGRKCEEYILDTLRQRAQGWIVDFDRAIPRDGSAMPRAQVDALVTAGESSIVVEVRARLRPFAVGQIETARDWLAALPTDLPVLIVMLGERLPEREQVRIIGDHQAPVGFLLWDIEPDMLIARLHELMTGARISQALES